MTIYQVISRSANQKQRLGQPTILIVDDETSYTSPADHDLAVGLSGMKFAVSCLSSSSQTQQKTQQSSLSSSVSTSTKSPKKQSSCEWMEYTCDVNLLLDKNSTYLLPLIDQYRYYPHDI